MSKIEEKREEVKEKDTLKNLKKINAIMSELDALKDKIKQVKSKTHSITKKISNKEKENKAKEEAKYAALIEELQSDFVPNSEIDVATVEAEADVLRVEDEVKEVKPKKSSKKKVEEKIATEPVAEAEEKVEEPVQEKEAEISEEPAIEQAKEGLPVREGSFCAL